MPYITTAPARPYQRRIHSTPICSRLKGNSVRETTTQEAKHLTRCRYCYPDQEDDGPKTGGKKK